MYRAAVCGLMPAHTGACARENLGKECKTLRLYMCCLSLVVFPYQTVSPKPEMLVKPFWITARDLSAAGTRERSEEAGFD